MLLIFLKDDAMKNKLINFVGDYIPYIKYNIYPY